MSMKILALLVVIAAHQDARTTLERPAPPVEERVLEVRKADDVVAKIGAADLAKAKPLVVLAAGGKARQVSLRDVLASAAGDKAKLVAVQLVDGRRVQIDPKDWASSERVPVLWQNRRGLFKLGWVDKRGQPVRDALELRDVRALVLE